MKIHNHDDFFAKLVSHVTLEGEIATIEIIHPNSKEVLASTQKKVKDYDEALDISRKLKESYMDVKTDIQMPIKKGNSNGKSKK